MTNTNSILQLVPPLLRTIANAAPSAGSFLAPFVDEILLGAAALIEQGEEGAQGLAELTNHIKSMAQAGRDPTVDDFNELRARSNAAHATIQASDSAETNAPPSSSDTPAA